MRTGLTKSRLSARRYQEGQAILAALIGPAKVPCVICGVWVRGHAGSPESACCGYHTCKTALEVRNDPA